MAEIVWEDPPDGRRRGRHVELLDAARSRPGEWASVDDEHASASANNIRRGFTTGAEAGEFETRTSQGRLYVRFVGKPNLKAAQ